MILKSRLHSVYSGIGPIGQAVVDRLYAAIPVRWRKKKGFWKYLQFLRKSQWESSEWHREYQAGQLQQLIEYVSRSSPYYRKLFRQQRIAPGDIRSLSDLQIIPVLSKQTLVQKRHSFLPTDFPKSRLIVRSTSGSTGEPFEFLQDYSAVMREEAFAGRHWENAGMRLWEPSVYLRSYIPKRHDATYHFDAVYNRHFFSAYHLDEKNLKSYWERMLTIGARFIFGYPSSLEIFADYLLEQGLSLTFRAAITGSEMLSEPARKKIEQALNTRIFDWYGLAEPTVTVGQCPQGSYHLFSEYGIMEILDADDRPVTEAGQSGRIVGTNFINRALPLIRYDTGDIARLATDKCECGRGTPVMISSIQGRKDDLLVGADGQYLPSVNFYTLFAEFGKEVNRFQLIQNQRNKFKLKLVRGPEFSDDSVNRITTGLNQRLGGRPSIDIEAVDRITPSRAGKIRAVIRAFEPVDSNKEA